MSIFQLQSDFVPTGDQPRAIREIVSAFQHGQKRQTLLGVTGSGKTFTAANVIKALKRPTLVLAHNKTLAAQLYTEFKDFFPNNAVEYFVSYYDYYQPEAYVPASDTYIDKDAIINDAIDRMRHAATTSLFEREDVIIIASVSCIYGLGSKDSYGALRLEIKAGDTLDRDDLIRELIKIQYERNDFDFHRGTFRVRGDILEIIPASEDTIAYRIEWFGDDIDSIHRIDPLRGQVLESVSTVSIYPSSHYVVTDERRIKAIDAIRRELGERLSRLRNQEKLLEAQRLEQRTQFDLEMLETMGYCNGIENYTRHLNGFPEGFPPPVLIEYFPKDFLMIVDESHQSIPQVGAMYRGDRARKETLVDYGFRLPSALDNRPLRFEEFDKRLDRVLYISATPGEYEIEQSGGVLVEQVIRPTGLLDPIVEVRSALTQVDDLLKEIRARVKDKERVLVTTLTKRMAEDLTEFLAEAGVKVRYLHSDVKTLERIELIQDLRRGEFDVLVGINLLREGLDIPEVSLVAILDADKEGFLRSERSLIQTIGRAARNAEGRVILYAENITASMKKAMDETSRRRALQQDYNQKHGIQPKTIIKEIKPIDIPNMDGKTTKQTAPKIDTDLSQISPSELTTRLEKLRKAMRQAAKDLEFEKAAELRDQVRALEKVQMELL